MQHDRNLTPQCRLVVPDKRSKIRWVRGLLPDTGEVVYIPAVMVYSHLGNRLPGERFWLPTSTGCAAEVSYERALLSAIYEAIERDAISITWLQKLALPRIQIDNVPAELHWGLGMSRRVHAARSRFSFSVVLIECQRPPPHSVKAT